MRTEIEKLVKKYSADSRDYDFSVLRAVNEVVEGLVAKGKGSYEAISREVVRNIPKHILMKFNGRNFALHEEGVKAMELRKYTKMDAPAGTELDIQAQLLAKQLNVSYAEAFQLVLLQNAELAKSYVEQPNEQIKTYSDVDVKGEDLHTKVKAYMKENPDIPYGKACEVILEKNPDLYE